MTKPFINENILNRIFGEKADRVKETFCATPATMIFMKCVLNLIHSVR